MNESLTYAMNLERKLILEFKKKFYEKMGYMPVVVTKTSVDQEQLPILTLEELEECFEELLPIKNYKKIRLKSKYRDREIVDLRKIFCMLARSMRYTLKTIGTYLGGKDHTTILHNIKTFTYLYESNESFKSKYSVVVKKIKEKHGTSIMEFVNQAQHQPESDLLAGLLQLQDPAF